MKESCYIDSISAVGQYVIFPTDFAISPCKMCGKCCNNDWVVEMDAEDFNLYADILNKTDLPDEHKRCLQTAKYKDGNIHKLLPCKGRCVFLMPDNKCYVHSQYGPEAKSRVCLQYPLSVDAFSPRGMHIKTSFICPSILNSILSSNQVKITNIEWTNEIICLGTVKFHDGSNISWEAFFLLNDALSGLFMKKPYNVEDNLLMSGIWSLNLIERYKNSRSNEIDTLSAIEFLSENKKSLLEIGSEFKPDLSEQMYLMSDVAFALMQGEFMKLIKEDIALGITRLLGPNTISSCYGDKIREAYRQNYIKELPVFSYIIEKYLLHKILSIGMFTRNGFVHGINHLALCYSFIRLYILAEIIFGKNKLQTQDVMDAISFVEMIFFHRRSSEYLESPHMLKILSNPVLSLNMIRL